ncbi:MAG: N-acetylneuraminate synthase [Lachnospiraceae bacterium]|nr:N-acetylneuraminate synthase [Lachnospiraceae bacterium]
MKTFIIAEAGVNHNGNLKIAKKMVDAAVLCDVDAIKFQTFKAENLVSKIAPKADYQIDNTRNNESQLQMVEKLALSYDEFSLLNEYCMDKKILFLSTPFDLESIDFLEKIGMPVWKIPSGEITNLPYLIKIANTNKPVIMSTGMSEMDEIKAAVRVLEENGAKLIKLLHCNTEYPTPYEDVNLLAMQTLRNEFDCEVGYSDHTQGTAVSIAAVALGAGIIEKHFTLDRDMEGPDHKASLEPDELKEMVESIRNIEKSLGTPEKKVSESERKNLNIARKSIVAACDISEGEIFNGDNITVKRPGNGISPMKWNELLGKAAKKNFREDELIEI